jgi:hypothetical protein
VRTALDRNVNLGWAEISHLFIRSEVLKSRRVTRVDTLILRGSELGSLSIACEMLNPTKQLLARLPFDVVLLRLRRLDNEREVPQESQFSRTFARVCRP